MVAGIGIEPNTHSAEAAGLKVDDGILVDHELRTGAPDIYAAGDVASFYNPAPLENSCASHGAAAGLSRWLFLFSLCSWSPFPPLSLLPRCPWSAPVVTS